MEDFLREVRQRVKILVPDLVESVFDDCNIPTLFSKTLTERVLSRWIHFSGKVLDP